MSFIISINPSLFMFLILRQSTESHANELFKSTEAQMSFSFITHWEILFEIVYIFTRLLTKNYCCVDLVVFFSCYLQFKCSRQTQLLFLKLHNKNLHSISTLLQHYRWRHLKAFTVSLKFWWGRLETHLMLIFCVLCNLTLYSVSCV